MTKIIVEIQQIQIKQISDNDGIGNVCDDTPNGGNTGTCEDVVVADGGGRINISNIPAGAKIEYNGPATNYAVELVCENNCGSTQVIENLAPGDYNVKVQTFNPYCYASYPITVTGGGGGNPCDGQGGDSDGDGICDDQDNCRNTANTNQADNDNDGIGNVCDDTPNGGNTGTCEDVSANMTNGQLTISGLGAAPIIILKVFDSSWSAIFECNGNKCPETVIFSPDQNEQVCHIDVQLYTADWQLICSRTITVTSNAATTRSAPQLNFAAFRQDRSVALQWLSNSGWRNEYFELERSIDGKTFESIKQVMNDEDTDELVYYENVDEQPQIGVNYYRIKQVSKDGTYEYTNIEPVMFSIDLEGFSMYPNPAKEGLTFNMKPFIGKAATINIVNNFGQIVQKMELNQITATEVYLSLDRVTSGFYQVMILVEGQKVIVEKVIVEKLY